MRGVRRLAASLTLSLALFCDGGSRTGQREGRQGSVVQWSGGAAAGIGARHVLSLLLTLVARPALSPRVL